MTHIASLLELTLRNTFGEGLSNQAITFAQTQAIVQPEEMMGEQSQEPQYNATFMQSILLAPIPAAINVFVNES